MIAFAACAGFDTGRIEERSFCRSFDWLDFLYFVGLSDDLPMLASYRTRLNRFLLDDASIDGGSLRVGVPY